MGPSAGNDVDDARREPDLGRELGEPQRGQRRLRVGLQHDGAPGRQRGRQLPGRHRQRVVPGDDLAGDADRLLQRVEEERAAERARAPGDRGDRGGVEAEVLRGLVDLGLHGRDGLADVAHLELGELLPVRDDRVGERVEKARALGRRRLAPRAAERGAGGLDGAVDVLLAGHRGAAEHLAGGGLDEVAKLAGRGLDGLAADEEAVLALDRDAHVPDDTGSMSATRVCSVSSAR